MSDENLPSVDANEEELKQALAAAFGEEGMDFLDDEDDELDLESFIDGEQSANCSLLEKEIDVVAVKDDDAPLIRYVKELSREIYAVGQRPAKAGQTSTAARFVVFAVNNQQFGVPLTAVSEIGRYPKVNELPRTPSWLRGVANLRGQILSVTDLRHLLNIPGENPGNGEKVIVVHCPSRDACTAIVVDRVLGIRNLESAAGSASDLTQRVATIASGSTKFDQTTTALIDPGKLFECAELLLTFTS